MNDKRLLICTHKNGIFSVGLGNIFFYFCLMMLLVSLFVSCRKLDTSNGDLNRIKGEENFFKTSVGTNAKTIAIANYLSNENKRLAFVTKTIERVGNPVWEKLMYYPGKRTAQQRGGEGAETDVYYIPFVRENENYVNAIIVVHAGREDTTFSWRCDWQYQSLSKGQTAATDTAGMYANMFMSVNNVVFGHSLFAITDSSLFEYNNVKAVYVRVMPDTTANFLNVVTHCSTVQVSFVDCTYGPGTGYCETVCDGCFECRSYIGYTYCYDSFEDDGGIFPPNGGSGSSGSSSGSGTPPVCGSGRGTTNPCGPPWLPVDDEDLEDPHNAAPFPRNPCKVVDSLLKIAQFQAMMQGLRDSTTLNYEIGYSVENGLDTASFNAQHYSGVTSPVLAVDIKPTTPVDIIAHNHNDNPQRLHNASVEDFYKLCYYWSTGKINNLKRFAYPIVTDSTAYILMISDTAQFISFAQTWFASENTMNAFRNLLYRENEYGKPGNSILENEMKLLKTLQTSAPGLNGCGLKLFRGNTDMTIFSPIKVSSNGLVRPAPCN